MRTCPTICSTGLGCFNFCPVGTLWAIFRLGWKSRACRHPTISSSPQSSSQYLTPFWKWCLTAERESCCRIANNLVNSHPVVQNFPKPLVSHFYWFQNPINLKGIPHTWWNHSGKQKQTLNLRLQALKSIHLTLSCQSCRFWVFLFPFLLLVTFSWRDLESRTKKDEKSAPLKFVCWWYRVEYGNLGEVIGFPSLSAPDPLLTF